MMSVAAMTTMATVMIRIRMGLRLILRSNESEEDRNNESVEDESEQYEKGMEERGRQ